MTGSDSSGVPIAEIADDLHLYRELAPDLLSTALPVGLELGGLDARHRDLLLLRYVVDLQTDDLVEVLGCASDVVEERELEALMALRQALPLGSQQLDGEPSTA